MRAHCGRALSEDDEIPRVHESRRDEGKEQHIDDLVHDDDKEGVLAHEAEGLIPGAVETRKKSLPSPVEKGYDGSARKSVAEIGDEGEVVAAHPSDLAERLMQEHQTDILGDLRRRDQVIGKEDPTREERRDDKENEVSVLLR